MITETLPTAGTTAGIKPTTAKKAKKTAIPAQALFTAEDYAKKISTISTTILRPSFMPKLVTPEYQRGANAKQVKRIQRALMNNEFVPDVILGLRVVDGKRDYIVVDGLQRVTAAMGISFPLRATVIDFGTPLNEIRHFVAFQRTVRVNANLLCAVFGSDAKNAEVNRIAALVDHPLHGKVWFGRDTQPNDALASTKLTSAVSKTGLALEELEACTRTVTTVWDVQRKSLPYSAGGFRGLINFYQAIAVSDFDHRNAKHVAHMRAFDWETVRANATNNSAAAGTVIGEALLKQWKSFKN